MDVIVKLLQKNQTYLECCRLIQNGISCAEADNMIPELLKKSVWSTSAPISRSEWEKLKLPLQLLPWLTSKLILQWQLLLLVVEQQLAIEVNIVPLLYTSGNVDQQCCPLLRDLDSLFMIGLLRNTACKNCKRSVVVLVAEYEELKGTAVFTDDRLLGTTGAIEGQNDCCGQKSDAVL